VNWKLKKQRGKNEIIVTINNVNEMRQVKTALKYYEKGNDEVRRNKYYICEKECVKRSR